MAYLVNWSGLYIEPPAPPRVDSGSYLHSVTQVHCEERDPVGNGMPPASPSLPPCAPGSNTYACVMIALKLAIGLPVVSHAPSPRAGPTSKTSRCGIDHQFALG